MSHSNVFRIINSLHSYLDLSCLQKDLILICLANAIAEFLDHTPFAEINLGFANKIPNCVSITHRVNGYSRLPFIYGLHRAKGSL